MTEPNERQIVLVVDDVPENVALIADYLEGVDCEVVTATSATEALDLVAGRAPDLVLTDVEMPGMNGLELCRQIKSAEATSMVPVVVVTAYSAVDDRVAALEAGADDFLAKPVEQNELLARVRSLLRIKTLYDSLVQTEQVVFALARAVEAKDKFTEAHSERVAQLAKRLAMAAGLDPDTVAATYFAARVHDIGKIGVSDDILNKKDALAPEEVAEMRRVPIIGAEICRPLRSSHGITDIIRHQKERVDGAGYPDGLSGDSIPAPAKILAICDAYDSMVSGERAERPQMADERARAVLLRQAGRAYDENLVRLFFDTVLLRLDPAPTQGGGGD
ncbi:MAG TPA: response regulator [Candidatus Dormibacteraeota bacterium]|jgi:putative two-component system response regulator